MRIIIHPEASAELEAAAMWYEERAGLGGEFLAEAERAVALIEEAPEAWPAWAKAPRPGVRRFLFGRFQYAAVYVVREEQVLIVAFSHLRRHPSYWLRRLRDRDE